MTFSVAIVTGGNKGIGLGIVKTLLENNYKVVTCGRSEFKDINLLKDLEFIKGDAKDFKTHQKLVDHAINSFGKLDLYVNNVGVSEWKPIDKIDNDFLDKIFKTNIYSVFWGSKAASKILSKKGSIINISSIAGKRGSKNNSVYVASKFAMNGITQSLAKELGSKNIRVNAISAGPIKTLAASAIGDAKFLYKWNEDHSFLKRNVDIHDVGNSALYLLSNLAAGVTGEIHYVDAGYNKVGMPDPKNMT